MKNLKRLQDVLGELHDGHVLGREIGAAFADVAADRARRFYASVCDKGVVGTRLRDELRDSPRAGLLGIARLLRERRDALFSDLEHAWRAAGVDTLAAEVEGIAAALDARAGGKFKSKRKYLLSAVPSPAPPRLVDERSGMAAAVQPRRIRARTSRR